jgi:ADP-ribose pyrophosphatase YjhB (NUDIX family)
MCCPTCGFVHYSRFTVGVGGLVVADQRVLLVHRVRPGPTGSWLIPGGYIEQNERVNEAAVREVREETGLETVVEGLVGLRSRVLEREHSVYIVLLLTPCGGSLRPDGIEVDDVRYFSLREIDETEGITPFSRWLARRAATGDLPLIRESSAEMLLAGPMVYYG